MSDLTIKRKLVELITEDTFNDLAPLISEIQQSPDKDIYPLLAQLIADSYLAGTNRIINKLNE
jgi:hypothetical protein